MKDDFMELGLEAGFSKEQLEFLEEHLAKYPHTHDIDDVVGLQEALEDISEEEEDDD